MDVDSLLAGRYHLEQTLRRQPGKAVWRAWDAVLQRSVVVKVRAGAPDSPEVEALKLELWRLHRCRALHIPAPLDAGVVQTPHLLEESNAPLSYFTQPFLAGPSLTQRRGKLSVNAVRELAVQLLALVAGLHRAGLHGLDLKSAHLILEPTGWHLIDLDVARTGLLEQATRLEGAVAYAAPELLRQEDTDARADLYSVGILLYEALTGGLPPLPGETLDAIAQALPRSPRPSLPEALVQQDPPLADLCHTLLARSPADRPASAEAALLRLGPSQTRSTFPPLPDEIPWQQRQRDHLLRQCRQLEQANGGALLLLGADSTERTHLLEGLVLSRQLEGRPVLQLRFSGNERPGEAVCQLLSFLNRVNGKMLELDQDSGLQPLPPQPLEALNDALQALPRTLSPVLVCLTDVDRMDEVSRLLFEQILPQLEGRGLGVLWGAATETHVMPAPHRALRYTLESLTLTDVRELTERVLSPSRITEEGLEHLLHTAGGQLSSLWQLLELARNQADASLKHLLPPGQEQRWTEEFQRLNPSAGRLLTLASLMEDPFESSVLKYLWTAQAQEGEGEASSEETYASLRQLLLQRGLWLPARTGAGSRVEEASQVEETALSDHAAPLSEEWFRIPDRAMAQWVAGQASEDQRQQTHVQIAEILEQLPDDVSRRAEQIARHLVAAGQGGRARPWLQKALDGARQEGRLAAALELAAELLRLHDPRLPGRAELLRTQASLQYDLQQHDAARQTLEALLLLGNLAPTLLARGHAELGKALLAQGQAAKASEKLVVALQPERARGIPLLERLRWQLLLTDAHLRGGQLDAARTVLAEAEGAGIPSDSLLEVERRHLRLKLALQTSPSAPDPGDVSAAEKALALATKLGDWPGQAALLNILVRAWQQSKQLPRAVEALEQLLAKSRARFDLPREAAAARNLAQLRHRDHKLDMAIGLNERAARLFDLSQNRRGQAGSLLDAVELLLDLRHINRSDELLNQVSGNCGQALEADRRYRLWFDTCRARLDGLLGRIEGLGERLLALQDQARGLAFTELEVTLVVERGYLALKEGRFDDATQLVREATRLAKQPEDPILVERVQRLRTTIENPGRTEPESRVDDHGTPVLFLEHFRRLIDLSQNEKTLAARLAAFVGVICGGRALLLTADAKGRFVTVNAEGATPVYDAVSSTVIREVSSTKEDLVCPDIRAHSVLSHSQSLLAAKALSVVCLPLLHSRSPKTLVGVLYAEHPSIGRLTTPTQLSMFKSVAQLARELLEQQALLRETEALDTSAFSDMIGVGPQMESHKQQLARIVKHSGDGNKILVLGEPGVGKTSTASQFWKNGTRAGKPFIVCDDLGPEDLVESTLFGHFKGAFTGATTDRVGLIECADGGTFFLDEVGDVPLALQKRLLRVVDTGYYRRMGQDSPDRRGQEGAERHADVHWIFATNRNLTEMVEAKTFRADLYDRIRQVTIQVPSLRMLGKETIGLQLKHFISQRLKVDRDSVDLDQFFERETLSFLLHYDWPGNTRRLKDMVSHPALKEAFHRQERVTIAQVEEALFGHHKPSSPVSDRQNAVALDALAQDLLNRYPKATFDEIKDVLWKIRAKYLYERVLRNHSDRKKTAEDLQMSRWALYDNCPMLSPGDRDGRMREELEAEPESTKTVKAPKKPSAGKGKR